MPKATVRKRKALSAETKKAICIFKRDHPTCTAKEVMVKFGLDADRSTITKIFKESERWLKKDTSGDAGQLTKERKETFVKVNDALSTWVTGALAANHIINDKILQLKAREFAHHFPDEAHFKASDGWVEGFKKRNNLRRIRIQGEANSVPLEILPEERDRLRQIIGEYDLANVYNADETSLFFRMPPNMTLATGKTSGAKRDKSRITVLLACNATGSDKLKPLVIGKAGRPHCFRNVNMNTLPVTYRNNQKAWMRSDIFMEWLNSLNRTMYRKNKKILLLVDNAGPHGSDPPPLSNVTLKYLPPSTTAHLQPLDAGIIAAFKAHYRKLFLFHMISQYDGKIPEQKISLKDAVYFLVDAWNEVTADTIQNCWRHTGILGNGQRQAEPLDIGEILQNEVQVLINHIDIAYAEKLSAIEYIGIDQSEPALEFISDNDIVQQVNKKYNSNDADDTVDSDDEPPPPPISAQDGKSALERTLRYCEEQDNSKIDNNFLAKLRALIRDASVTIQKEKKQLTLEHFFK